VLWQLPVSLTAVVALAACAGNGPNIANTSTSGPTTAAPAVTTSTGVTVAPAMRGPEIKKWIDLEVGDCLADRPSSDPSVITVTTVDCATAHQAEVYLRAPVGVNAAIADVADRECDAGFSQYSGRSIDGSPFAVTYLIDSTQDRTSANPTPSTVICLLQPANGQPLTKSARR
jgi:hypothetical protein